MQFQHCQPSSWGKIYLLPKLHLGHTNGAPLIWGLCSTLLLCTLLFATSRKYELLFSLVIMSTKTANLSHRKSARNQLNSSSFWRSLKLPKNLGSLMLLLVALQHKPTNYIANAINCQQPRSIKIPALLQTPKYFSSEARLISPRSTSKTSQNSILI